jgi:hypothetical protein
MGGIRNSFTVPSGSSPGTATVSQARLVLGNAALLDAHRTIGCLNGAVRCLNNLSHYSSTTSAPCAAPLST